MRADRLVLVSTVATLAALPPALVLSARWLDYGPVKELFDKAWCGVPVLCTLATPGLFEIALVYTFLLLAALWLYSPLHASTLQPVYQESPLSEHKDGNRSSIGLRWVVIGSAGILVLTARQVIFGTIPGWELALFFGVFLIGWLVYDLPFAAVASAWRQHRGPLALYLFLHLALILSLAALYSPQRFTALSLGLIAAAALAVLLFRARIHPLFWIFSLSLALMTFNLDAWQFSIVGDEFAFYRYAREIVEQQDWSFILGHLFNGTAVYESHPYLSSLIQAFVMKALDLQNFGWRFSSIYAAALSLPFFYFFFKSFTSRRIALTATFLLGTAHYLLNFSKIGYNNTQALLAMGVALAAASWAVQRPRPTTFVALGIGLAFCLYVYPAAAFIPPLALLLVLLYRPPFSRAAIANWGLMALTFLFLVFPLFSQSGYWTSKLPGTFLSHPDLAGNSSAFLLNLFRNVIYSLYSFLYVVHESHFVTVAYADAITGALALLGLALALRLAARRRFALFLVIGLAYLAVSVGATHGLEFPPVTRMFLFLPWFSLLAALGLDWLIARSREAGLGTDAVGLGTALVLFGALALNLIQANIISPRRSLNYQNESEATLLLAQQLAVAEPDLPQSLVVLNDPARLHVPNLVEILQIYYLNPTVYEVRALEQPPEDYREELIAPDNLVVAYPQLPEEILARYQVFLEDNDRIECQLLDVAGRRVLSAWFSPNRGSLCSEEAAPSISIPYTLSGSPQLSRPGTSDVPSALALLVLIVAGLAWWRAGALVPSEIWASLPAIRTRSRPRPALPDSGATAVLGPSEAAAADRGRAAARLKVPPPFGIWRDEELGVLHIEVNLRLRPRRDAPPRSEPEPLAPNVESVSETPAAPLPAAHQAATTQSAPLPVGRPRLPAPRAATSPRLRARSMLLEWGVLTLIALLFARNFLNFDPNRVLWGNEYEDYACLDLIFVNTLRQFGQVPLWNFFLRTGWPYIADPFTHIFTPVSTVPILLWGVVNGFKVSIVLSFVLAAVGQWLLSYTLGLDRPARIWTALMYALGGQGVARITQGQYLFLMGFAWIPFVFAGVVMSLRTRKLRYYALTSLALALLFFSGNVYYAYYMAIILCLFALVAGFRARGWSVQGWDWRRVAPLLIIGILALGLVAIQLVPMFELWPHFSKPGDPELLTSQPVSEVMLDYLSTSTTRPEARANLGEYDFYSYIGLTPFLLAPLALGAFWHSRRKDILALAALFLFVLFFISMRYTPVAPLFARFSWINQFRLPSRILAYGACAIISLAGIGISWAIEWLGTRDTSHTPRGVIWNLRGLGIVALLVLMLYSAADVFLVNTRFFVLGEVYQPGNEELAWLHRYDPELHYVGLPYSTGWHFVVTNNQERFWSAYYGFEFFPPAPEDPSQRPVVSRPNYVIAPKDKQPVDEDAVLLRAFERDDVYMLEQSLPYAFAVTADTLTEQDAGDLQRADVVPLHAVQSGANALTMTAETGQAATWVVAMTSYYPGWRVSIDGRPAALRSVGKYLAVEAEPGRHTYTFEFDPLSVKIGLGISLVSWIVLLGMLLGVENWKWIRQSEQSFARRESKSGIGEAPDISA